MLSRNGRFALALLSGLSFSTLLACGGVYSSEGYGSSPPPDWSYDSGAYDDDANGYGYGGGNADGEIFSPDGARLPTDAGVRTKDAAPPPPPPPPPPVLHWRSLASMPTARDGLAAVFGTDGRLYAIGGYGEGGVTGVVEAYTPATNSWTTVAPLPTPRHGLTAVLGHNGLIYAIGDYNDGRGDAQSAVVEAYSSTTDTWTHAPSLVKGRFHASAVVAPNGRLYVMGGQGPNGVYASVESYTPGDSTWVTETKVMTNARYAFGAAIGGDGQIHAFGGENAFHDELATNESAAPGGSWNTRTDLTFARIAFATAAAGGRIYAFGGEQRSQNVYELPLKSVTAYDPASNSWSAAEDMPTTRFFPAAATGPDGKIYVVGGVGAERALDVFTP